MGEHMFTMASLSTNRQQEILSLLESRQATGAPPSSYREIGEHVGIANVSAVAKHINALRRKGLLATTEGKARSIQVQTPYQGLRRRIAHIPLVGSIPAGPPGDREQDARQRAASASMWSPSAFGRRAAPLHCASAGIA